MPRWREDVRRAGLVVVASVLLGAPTGLVWSLVAPRLTFTVGNAGVSSPDLESTKAFIGADGTFLIVVALVGVLAGLLAGAFARRSGPWTVLALALGGTLGALVAARVGVLPGTHRALEALQPGTSIRGTVELYLGRLDGQTPHLRSFATVVGWPVAAVAAFLAVASYHPEDLD